MRNLLVAVPDELVKWVGGDEKEASRLLTQAAVAELVRRRVVSSAKASELLDCTTAELIEVLRIFEVSVIDVDVEEPFSQD